MVNDGDRAAGHVARGVGGDGRGGSARDREGGHECRGEQRGALANLVTPTVVDPNSYAPEYKGFLVRLDKV